MRLTPLVTRPGIGHKREDLTAYPVLFWPVGAYLVIYRTTSRLVEIVAVTQGARDIPAFLHLRVSQWFIAPPPDTGDG